MKIGILTHHYVSNYGAFLQAYCLRETLADLFPGDDVFLIDFINRRHMLINTAGFLRFSRGKETFVSWREKLRQPAVFAKARKSNMVLTPRVFCVEGLNRLGLDAIVVGSDEVWNYADMRSYLPVKFGCGIAPGMRLISYAASVGGIRAFENAPAELSGGISRFDALSARDDHTEAFLRAMGREDAVRVLDPVFLHATPDGKTSRVARLIEQPYLLFYHCALSERSRAQIASFAREQGLRILGAGEYDRLYSERSVDLSPFEWAELFRHARHVFTGTFHGAVFSIVNERSFSVCPNNPTRAEKLRSLLSQFSLEGCMVAPEDDAASLALARVDYSSVTPKVKALAAASREYLKNALAR